MSLQFPSNPTNGQTYQPSGQPQIYTYSGGKWAVKYNAQTASNAEFAQSASQAENANYALTASYALNGGGGSIPTLDQVAEAGGTTTRSISVGELSATDRIQSSQIIGNLNGNADTADLATSASHADMANTASYVTILGDGITVNYSELGIELTGSGGGGSNLDGTLALGHTTSGSITMGEYPYWPTNWAATASLAIGSGSLSLTSHSIALGLNSVAGNPNSIAIGNGSVTGRYLYDDGSILGIDQSQVRWTGLGLPTPPVDWFKVGKSYIAFGDEIALTEADIRKAIIINNVTSVQSDMLGRLTVNHSGLTGNNINAINSTKPRIWIEIDSAPYSFAQGEGVFSAGASQHVIGQYNSELSDEGALIVGNGADKDNRSNLLVASGNTVQITGSLWVNGTEITGGGGIPTLDQVVEAGGTTTRSITVGELSATDRVQTNQVIASDVDTDNLTSDIGYIIEFSSDRVNQGSSNIAEGAYSHVEGSQNTAVGNYSHAEGIVTTAIGANSHAEGAGTTSVGGYSHAEGEYSRSTGVYSHAEGNNTNSDGNYSHAEGQNTTSGGANSHAEGFGTIASGPWSHAEGYQTVASFIASHAEGYLSVASADPSHAEGISTLASGIYSHAEGNTTVAAGRDSHAEGKFTTSVGDGSHAEGLGTISAGNYSHAQGQYNLPITDQSALVVGKGTDDANRANILEVLPLSNITNIDSNVVLPHILLHDYNNDGEAAAGGIPVGGLYQKSGAVYIRRS